MLRFLHHVRAEVAVVTGRNGNRVLAGLAERDPSVFAQLSKNWLARHASSARLDARRGP
jgi:hypothetical protein